MATYHGSDGTAALGTNLYHITRWALHLEGDSKDITAFSGSAAARVYTGGNYTATFELDSYLDDTSAQAELPGAADGVGMTTTLTFTGATEEIWVGVGLITAMDMEVALEGASDISMSGVITSDLTQPAS